MPYQDRQVGENSPLTGDTQTPTFQAQEQPNSSRTVRIIIAVGLVAAIIVAVFGRY